MASAPDPWSAPTATLYDRMREILDEGGEAALATIVGVEGSAYRRPGAKMVIESEGNLLGAITAGCLEGPVADLASAVLESGESTVETYDLTNEDTWGLGLGCNGVIDVLVEPLTETWQPALDRLAKGLPVATLTVVDSSSSDIPVGSRATMLGEKSSERSWVGSLPHSIIESIDLEPYLDARETDTVVVEFNDEQVEVFVDVLEPPTDLLIFGWQRDVHPVCQLARQVGFHVTVASARGGRSDAEDFPAADRVVSTRPNEIAEHVEQPERTYAVLMSHDFLDDRLALESLLDAGVPYVGLMGPRKRFEELRDDLASDGRTLTDEELERIATPVGIDLGGGEPSEIALSIVAEVLAVTNERDGRRLTDSKGPIHPRLGSLPER